MLVGGLPAQLLLEVGLEPAAQRDQLRIPLQGVVHVVEAAVVQLVQGPQGELGVLLAVGGGQIGDAGRAPAAQGLDHALAEGAARGGGQHGRAVVAER